MNNPTKILLSTESNIAKCAGLLRNGRLVAFPTETVYALGAVATNEKAVRKVFAVKKRPLDRPLIVAVARKEDIASVVKTIPPKAQKLIDTFMPGALTVVLERADSIPDVVTAGTDSVAVRIPDNEIAQSLIDLVRKPVVVPSANTSEKPSPTTAKHVKDDLDGKIEFILDGGESDIGIESTIVDVRTDPPTVLREGGVSKAEIEEVIGAVATRTDRAKQGAFKPNAEVLFSAYYEGMADNIIARYDALAARGERVVILALESNRARYGERNVYSVGKNYTAYAHNLFALLRCADDQNFGVVIAEGVPPEGIGTALISRLIKLSNGWII